MTDTMTTSATEHEGDGLYRFPLLVTGDRNWTAGQLLIERLEIALASFGPLLLIEGCARGADRIACTWRPNDPLVNHHHYPADWKMSPRGAGPIRNRVMLRQQPRLVLAFHDDLGASKGTRDMVTISLAARIPVVVWHSDGTHASMQPSSPPPGLF